MPGERLQEVRALQAAHSFLCEGGKVGFPECNSSAVDCFSLVNDCSPFPGSHRELKEAHAAELSQLENSYKASLKAEKLAAQEKLGTVWTGDSDPGEGQEGEQGHGWVVARLSRHPPTAPRGRVTENETGKRETTSPVSFSHPGDRLACDQVLGSEQVL